MHLYLYQYYCAISIIVLKIKMVFLLEIGTDTPFSTFLCKYESLIPSGTPKISSLIIRKIVERLHLHIFSMLWCVSHPSLQPKARVNYQYSLTWFNSRVTLADMLYLFQTVKQSVVNEWMKRIILTYPLDIHRFEGSFGLF